MSVAVRQNLFTRTPNVVISSVLGELSFLPSNVHGRSTLHRSAGRIEKSALHEGAGCVEGNSLIESCRYDSMDFSILDRTEAGEEM